MDDINNIRTLCADMVQKARSGHPGAPLGLAPFVYTLYTEFINFDPDDEKWIGRDIFLLSNGHACALQYAMNYLIGYLNMEDLMSFRQVGGRTPGHPERKYPGIESSTGPLGQGLANAVGFAISLKKLRHLGLSNRVYCIFGDGCYQEGIGQESFSLAANLKLDNIVFIYDFNKTTIDGPTSLSMNENVIQRFLSLGFEVELANGDDLDGIRKALNKKVTKPMVIILETVIGRGSIVEGSCKAHGSPLGEDGVRKLKEKFGIPEVDFYVSPSLLEKFRSLKEKKRKIRDEWNRKGIKVPTIQEHLEELKKIDTPYKSIYKPEGTQKATRKHFSEALKDLKETSYLIGGAADLQSSVLTKIGKEDLNAENYSGGYINFGIREHSMCGIINGIASHGYFLPYTGTFLNFISYGFPSVRIGCMDNLNLFYVLTHDSIGLGEDGPTHQPIEVLATLRATPNLLTMRPCDGTEVRASLYLALIREGPKAVILSRQNVPEIPHSSMEKAKKGAYYLLEVENPDLILLATGSEVQLCYEVAKTLSELKISIVSFFSWELFEEQEEEYKRCILKDVPKISIEALSTFGWSKYSDFQIGVDTFGMSGPWKDVYNHFGLNCKEISRKIVDFLNK
ncbi:transketolase [Encephalitozoon intestinalis ATCC 50506]|uniref:transketolase n=1 Tax=Encephalitozoon intestinalis (strain ATCC 50506) TaxID=876142 RepID=E0S7D2_ENCIT|nr:transketolase [Encephalitozoon intestinalis ATCC 50506]ADM11611.2 transketolase [Encephalitozoon intestinalis ATCC 50506]UTX45338.1 transketolase [Encephalitozoon intestinalis]